MLRSRKISSLGLKLETTSQISGYTIKADPAMSPRCFSTEEPLLWRLRLGMRLGAAEGRRDRTLSVIIEYPESRCPEVDRGECRDHDQEEPGHRRGVAHVVLQEADSIQEQRVEHRRVGGTARAPGDHVGLREGLEREDDLPVSYTHLTLPTIERCR